MIWVVSVAIDLSRTRVAGINEILIEGSGDAWEKPVVSRLGIADVG